MKRANRDLANIIHKGEDYAFLIRNWTIWNTTHRFREYLQQIVRIQTGKAEETMLQNGVKLNFSQLILNI